MKPQLAQAPYATRSPDAKGWVAPDYNTSLKCILLNAIFDVNGSFHYILLYCITAKETSSCVLPGNATNVNDLVWCHLNKLEDDSLAQSCN